MIAQPGLFDVDGEGGDVEYGYRAPAVQTATGVTYRQLDYWARTGVVAPSVRAARGSGSQRLYSFSDIVSVKIVKRLLDTGISLQNVRKAIAVLAERDVDSLSDVTLIGDGVSVYEMTDEGDLVDLLSGGQCVFGLAIKHTAAEVRGTVASLPREAGSSAAGDIPCVVGDELASRRGKRRRAS